MSFTSINFILFFIITIVVYFILPAKVKNIWLLITSLYFYLCSSVKGFVILIFVATLSYVIALMINHYTNKKKLLLTIGIIGIAFTLVLFKFANTFTGGQFFIPLGISFFTLQAIGYLVDVYKDKIKAEKNFIDYLLFIAFFPYVCMGPIERAKNILPILKQNRKFDYDDFCHGLQYMLYGFFLKLVVAERLSIIANTVFHDYMRFLGVQIAIGILAFTLQIYCDFAGYTYLARGMAKALGITIMENFEQPYFAISITEFWKRWHIGLSSWLRDYIYIPLGGNQKGRIRKNINIIIVFIVSGIWHGANWNFIVWGLLHGIYQVIGNYTRGFKQKVLVLFKIKQHCFSFKILQVTSTFILVSIAWVFFRVDSIKVGVKILWRMISTFSIVDTLHTTRVYEDFAWTKIGVMLDTSNELPIMDFRLNIINLIIVTMGVIVVLLVDLIHYKKLSCTKWLDTQNLYFRWLVYIASIFILLTFGIYGGEYDATSFIYSNF